MKRIIYLLIGLFLLGGLTLIRYIQEKKQASNQEQVDNRESKFGFYSQGYLSTLH